MFSSDLQRKQRVRKTLPSHYAKRFCCVNCNVGYNQAYSCLK